MAKKSWTYEGYWTTVLGMGNAADVCREFEFTDAEGLSEWLGTAESAAREAGGVEQVPEEWEAFHTKALAELEKAISEYQLANAEPPAPFKSLAKRARQRMLKLRDWSRQADRAAWMGTNHLLDNVPKTIAALEELQIAAALALSCGVVADAADLLGVSRRTVTSKVGASKSLSALRDSYGTPEERSTRARAGRKEKSR